jgi:hypothetical protein
MLRITHCKLVASNPTSCRLLKHLRFFSKAFVGVGNGDGYFFVNGRMRFIYPGPDTTFLFANGTFISLNNIAQVVGDFSGVTDGPSFYERFCTPGQITEGAEATAAITATTSVPGYPEPILITDDAVVSGYYLDGEGFDDVAVLALLAFANESPLEFQTIAQDFIAAAKAAGKTKIIVDLQANGGGFILQGYDMFRQFFPDIIQEDFTRVRENPTMLAISKIISDAIPDDYNPNTASVEIIEDFEVLWNYRYDFNLTEQPFLTFEDKFGPHTVKGDNFTSIIRWNLNDPLTTSNTSFGFGTDVTGYGCKWFFLY